MRRMALCGLAFVACFMSALVATQAAQKLPPPLPKPKPAELIGPGAEEPGVAGTPENGEGFDGDREASGMNRDGLSLSAIVIPREKPAELRRPEPGVVPTPGLEPDPQSRPDATVRPRLEPDAMPNGDEEKPHPGEDFATCRRELVELGASFKVPDMPAASGKCKVANPVQLTMISSPAGRIEFPSRPILNCIFAKRFTSWVSDIAAPVVESQTGEALVAISTGPGYECRGRNGDASGKISEHAFGNAIDIASFDLAGKEIMPVANVARTGKVESRWLMALRLSACGYFTTVLGPGSNSAHAEHYHFDMGLHGRSGNYRICE